MSSLALSLASVALADPSWLVEHVHPELEDVNEADPEYPSASRGPRLPPILSRAERATALAATLVSGRELLRRRGDHPQGEPQPTSLAALDRLLGGGLPRGRLTELVGRAASGRTTTILTVLAAVTRAGDVAALVDLGDGLDPRAAAALGIDLERLLWVRPARLKQALAATEAILQGGFPCAVLDLGMPPIPGGRGVEAGWLRLARAAASHGAVVLVASPYRVSGTAADVVLTTRGERPVWLGAGSRLLGGLATTMALAKARGNELATAAGPTARLRFAAPELLDPAMLVVAAPGHAERRPIASDEIASDEVAADSSNRRQRPESPCQPPQPPHHGTGPASATARNGWRAQAPRALVALSR